MGNIYGSYYAVTGMSDTDDYEQMNEFRKFMGLKAFNTFSEWNSDPDISV